MRKIIKGRLYDTETAAQIASTSGGGGVRDFRWYAESLYKKRTGEFYLAGKGGPLSKYAEHVDGGGWCGGEGIIPLTEAQAKEWTESNCSVDTYIEIFGEPTE